MLAISRRPFDAKPTFGPLCSHPDRISWQKHSLCDSQASYDLPPADRKLPGVCKFSGVQKFSGNFRKTVGIAMATFLQVAILQCGLLPSTASLRADDSNTRSILMPSDPSISPDGNRLAFAWIGEIWAADVDGSNVVRLTNNDATESHPLFSPDGNQIAFNSDRTGSSQIFVMQTDGTEVRQLTYHTAGYQLSDWFPNGRQVLALGSRDHYHRDATRMIQVDVEDRSKEKVLVDAMAEDAKVSPDGSKILFTREGERWWRKGYQGERSAQIWLYDLEEDAFEELVHEGVECMWPTWMANGKGFYFTKGELHGFDLWQYRFAKKKGKPGKQKRVYGFDDDSIVFPTIAQNGKTLLFRHLFHLYSMKVGDDEATKIELSVGGDVDLPNAEMRRELSSAREVTFTNDGLEVAFIAGGDVWVMDTVLREPKRVTATDGYEESLLFDNDSDSLWFVSFHDGQPDIWKATKKSSDQYWWQNDEFQLEQVTNDTHFESDLKFTPDGEHLVMQQGRGDLAVLSVDGAKKRTLVTGFSGLDYDLSSDGQWITYSKQDDDFNSEIWIAKLDGSMEPVNVSRHPDNDRSPVFSPDGKILAFTGRRTGEEVDVYYVYLQEEQDQETSRQRKIDEALELMKKKRKDEKSAKKPEKGDDASEAADEKSKQDGKEDSDEEDEESKDDANEDASNEDESDQIEIDFEGIHERVRKISIPNSFEGSLLFSPDGKKLAFSASVDGQRGWYTVEFPDKLTPKLLTTSTGSDAVWSKKAGGILFLRSGSPAKLEANGKLETYGFEVPQTLSRAGWLKAGFEKAWLTMREAWYDDRFANHNWDEIRRKYVGVAEQMHDTAGLEDVIYLMLGELNGSHLGFYASGTSGGGEVEGWEDTTAHLGVRFEEGFNGPGLLVRDVIKNGPADRSDSQMQSGDIILSIDGTAVDPAMDLTKILNGRLDRDIELQVLRESTDRDEEGEDEEEEAKPEELTVSIRPISYSRARSLLYDQWLDKNRDQVDEASDGKLGYLHIRAMDMRSFYAFERELYNVGYGREGIVIDVRDNGGGSTTDLLLTALTQPRHAITQPRGGGQGYPHDRAVFASWTKPIIVLCNQNSYSNAEIFSHAIKTLGRGKVVGVQTAGGVVSTGSATVNDVGRIRVPFRGWFLIGDGQDMERNGCIPHVVLWPEPGELPQGVDRQLEKAVELLIEEVGEGSQDAELTYAAERDLDEASESDAEE